jgi:hypothetical protein
MTSLHPFRTASALAFVAWATFAMAKDPATAPKIGSADPVIAAAADVQSAGKAVGMIVAAAVPGVRETDANKVNNEAKGGNAKAEPKSADAKIANQKPEQKPEAETRKSAKVVTRQSEHPIRKVRQYPPWVKVIVWPPDGSASAARPDDRATIGDRKAGDVSVRGVKADAAKAGKPTHSEKKANPRSKRLKVQGAEGLREDDLKMITETLGWVRSGAKRRVYIDGTDPKESSSKRVRTERAKIKRVLVNAGVKAKAIVPGAYPRDAVVAPTSYLLSNGIRMTLVTIR